MVACEDCGTDLSPAGREGFGYCVECNADRLVDDDAGRYSDMQCTDGGRNDDDKPATPPGWRDGPPEDALHPPGWREWDREARLNYLTLGHTRADLLAHLRGFIGSDHGSDRLTKKELAMIALDLEAI